MQHGLSYLPDARETDLPAPDYFRMLLELSALGDQAGLSHVKITEHYLRHYGGYCPSPLAFLSAVAARTDRIRLLTGCLLPVFHHPVQLASETAMVDAMSGGRLDVGFARAYLPYEFETFGVPMDGSRNRFVDTVTAVCELWTREGVSAATPHFAFRDATTLPRPVQRPHPPVWIAAVRSRSSFAWAGERGFGLLVTPALTPLEEMADHIAVYRESHLAAGHDHRPRVLASLPLFVADTTARAREVADPLLRHYLAVWAASAAAWGTTVSTDYRGYTGMERAIRAMTPERFRTTGSAVVGDPAEVVDRVHAIAEVLDVDGFLWQVDFGAVDPVTARGSVVRFCEQVLPSVAGVPVP
ncbi:alkanesulfonate monooxygenase SsuD/methylene tetrahydromethanopterin reductase-like flavin-dependent oxidoreductase (luciferase family) [Amycolatopsis lexingtonensis]|uniref:Alkanesulfonate monooxygenase SsuD/methylene tetrahydromethanopterin reductase-like flavin-dependent oxidoreductase (Luciferase family) n=1 Tax=Amycolatopsis lexingtonensis TaxID=218822 RepID=A0ABR9HQF4_9PSEU|nr:LLM class flavin-dependent oxidoreductase [Amycolatopsis lexingtonensis]MBE1493140.1 alkanesulfonate monooxygenase SsuD/methylene tetrahydromethanopterin reductase-like flavin-dependent oxidoreductase (luciferase family) [Amycolatopsis lexingtonensis]